MRLFERLSGDRSSVHTDDDFARSCGYEGPIVYGGIMTAKLSYMLGTLLPGDRGTSLRWQIDYRKPLSVGEPATIRLEVAGVSRSTRVVDGKFEIRTGEKLVATGKTQSIVPESDLP